MFHGDTILNIPLIADLHQLYAQQEITNDEQLQASTCMQVYNVNQWIINLVMKF